VSLAVFILPLSFNPFGRAPFELTKVIVCHIVLGGTLVMCAIRWLRARCSEPIKGAWGGTNPKLGAVLVLPALVYGGLTIVATAASVAPWKSLWRTSDGHGTAITLCTIFFFLLTASALSTREQIARVLTAMLLGSIPVAIYGLAQALRLDPLDWITDSVSPVLSTMGRSNYLGAYMAVVIPFTLLRLANPRSSAYLVRYALVLSLQIACLLATLARAAWLGFLGGCTAFLWLLALRRRNWRPAAASLPVLAVGLLLFALMSGVWTPQPADVEYGEHAQGPAFHELRAESLDRRRIIWQSTLELIPERWILGYGPETFEMVFSSRYPPGSLYEGTDVIVDDAHNLFLGQMMDTGVIGTLTLGWLIVAFLVTMLNALRTTENRYTQTIVAALLGSGTAFLIQAQFNPDVVVLSLLFWLILALAVVVRKWEPQVPSANGGMSNGRL
jgi:O-antigen ligase